MFVRTWAALTVLLAAALLNDLFWLADAEGSHDAAALLQVAPEDGDKARPKPHRGFRFDGPGRAKDAVAGLSQISGTAHTSESALIRADLKKQEEQMKAMAQVRMEAQKAVDVQHQEEQKAAALREAANAAAAAADAARVKAGQLEYAKTKRDVERKQDQIRVLSTRADAKRMKDTAQLHQKLALDRKREREKQNREKTKKDAKLRAETNKAAKETRKKDDAIKQKAMLDEQREKDTLQRKVNANRQRVQRLKDLERQAEREATRREKNEAVVTDLKRIYNLKLAAAAKAEKEAQIQRPHNSSANESHTEVRERISGNISSGTQTDEFY